MQLRAVLFDLHGVIVVGCLNDPEDTTAYQARDGLVELIDELTAAGVTLAVGTAAAREPALAILDSLGLRGQFAGVVGLDDVSEVKPDPEVYCKALALTGAVANEAVVIDDSPHGVQAARAAGLVAVAAPLTDTWPSWRKPRLAHLVVDSLRDLTVRRLNELLIEVWGPPTGPT